MEKQSEIVNVMMNTPIYPLRHSLDGVNIFVKREDMIPFSFGGNKLRIALELLTDMKNRGKTCMVVYGSVKSNLVRAVSNLCYSESIPCYVICSQERSAGIEEPYNLRIAELCNVKMFECNKENVSKTIKAVMEECKLDGYVPYYVYGNEYGRGNEKTLVDAYVKAYREIAEWEKSKKTKIDYIFVATGTGMTLSGLIAGKKIYQGKQRIIGISIARKENNQRETVLEYLSAYFEHKNVGEDVDIFITDDYLCGGYGKYSADLLNAIRYELCYNGLPLDTTYTGKAFWGMSDYIKRNNLQGNVLFLYTGGVPLFFDTFEDVFQ